MKISVIINTLNEEKNLPRALASVKGFADEIVIVDMHSDDDTAKIAKESGAHVYEHKRMGYVEPARNFAISKASGDWIFVLDADEEITSTLKEALRDITLKDRADYVAIPRKNIIFNKWLKHSRFWPDYNIRFFKKGRVIWSDIIHSVPMTTGKGMDLPAQEAYAIRHHHYETIEQYIERLNRYTTYHVKALTKTGYKFSWKDIISKPASEFMSRYFHGEGYKDGIHGLSLASLQAFSELVLYLKVWQSQDFKESEISVNNTILQMKKAQRDANYWYADTLVKSGKGISQRLKRKFRLP